MEKMENQHHVVTDVLIDELNFNNVRTAKYIKDRHEVIFNVTGSSTYSPSTQTQMNIVMNGDTILDHNTLRLNFKITNKETTANRVLKPLSSSHIFIKRIRLLSKNGVVIHDIDNYNRYVEQMLLLESKNHLKNYNSTNFNNSVNSIFND